MIKPGYKLIKNNNTKSQIFPGPIVDASLVIFVLCLILRQFEMTNRRTSATSSSKHRGRWTPNFLFLPILYLRWVLFPHHDWDEEHRQFLESHANNEVHHHHHHAHRHRGPHVHHHHHHTHPPAHVSVTTNEEKDGNYPPIESIQIHTDVMESLVGRSVAE